MVLQHHPQIKAAFAAVKSATDPSSRLAAQKNLAILEHIQGAVAHHLYEEEGNWFLDLKKKLPAADQTKLAFRYKEQYSRDVTHDGGGQTPWADELGPNQRSAVAGW
jgi:hypothetical protein